MPQTPASTPPSRPFYGWRVVAAAFLVAAFGWGLGFYGPAVYLEAVRTARGWPLSLVSGAVTVHFLAGVLVVTNLPGLHRRFGLPAVTLAGAVLLAAGIAGWSLAESLPALYGAALLSGAGWVALGAAAVNAMVAPWFVTGRPAALSTAYNGASVGGIVFSPLLVILIGRLGFPAAAALLGGLMVATIAALAATILRRTPEGLGQNPDGAATPPRRADPASPGSHRSRLRADPRFRTLAAGMALGLFAQIGLLSQLVSLLSGPLGPEGAGFGAALATAAAIAGRTLVGWTMPAGADRRRIAAACLLVQAAGCALFAAGQGSPALLLLGTALIGLGVGNATSLPPLIAQAEFPPAETARVVALIVGISQAAYAFAPALFGLLRDLAPGPALFVVAIAVQGLAALAYRAGRRTPTHQSGGDESEALGTSGGTR